MDKQKIRDRIAELEFKRREHIELIKSNPTLSIGLTTILFSLIFYQLDKGRLLFAVAVLILFFSVIIFLSKLYSYSSSKDKKIKEIIEKNYNLLLDREKLK